MLIILNYPASELFHIQSLLAIREYRNKGKQSITGLIGTAAPVVGRVDPDVVPVSPIRRGIS
jgi:hypothetical protein